MSEFQLACREFTAFRDLVNEALRITTDSEVRQRLHALGAGLDEAFADVQKTFPVAVNEMKRSLDATEESIRKTRQEIAALEAELAARASAPVPVETPPAPVASASPPLDVTALGTQYRNDLLERYAGLSHARAVPHDPGEVWEISSGQWVKSLQATAGTAPERKPKDKSTEKAPPVPVSVEPPPSSPLPRESGDADVGDMSSRDWH